ncbi:hypothetical protein ACPF7Z_15020, partial [Halomonas sp. GXIMD04776]|uniref:hypothetical protein n=1 Tax=Halomonas sp. GXIMD04776 TaxID=3415605 RepID=UPI003C828406
MTTQPLFECLQGNIAKQPDMDAAASHECRSLRHIRFVLFDEETTRLHQKILNDLSRILHQTCKKRLKIGYNSSSYTRTNRLSRHDKMYHADRRL